MRIGLIEDRFEYLSGKTLMKEEKVVQRYRFSAMKTDASQTLTGLGTGQGTWGASHLQLTKLTTVQSPVQKRQAAPVLPASLETFVAAIELLAERRRSCEVGLIGAGEGDTRFGTHTLASFPTHDPRKRKTIAWAWMKDLQKIDIGELQSLLLMCAMRRGWVSEDQVPGYQRKTTTHRELVGISVLESRIWRKIEGMFRSPASL